MSTIDLNYLGQFDSIDAVWAAHPEGGHEGDYLDIVDTRYRWNKYELIWENANTVTQSPARKVDNIDGDLHVQNNLHVGGKLYASVKQPNCGLFSSLSALQAAYPNPEVGMWATIGDGIPGDIYRCDTAGVWTATGETGGADVLDIPELKDEIKSEVNTSIGYFVCDTAAATAAKTIAATGYALATGGNIRIKMTNANTANAVTLNINNTGEKALFYNGAQVNASNSWEDGEIVEAFYDGTRYQINHVDYNDVIEKSISNREEKSLSEAGNRNVVTINKIHIDDTGVVVSSSSTNNIVGYTGKLKKGTIIKFTSIASNENAIFRVGFYATDPALEESIIGLQLDNYKTIYNTSVGVETKAYIQVPYDGYFFYYRLTTRWSSFALYAYDSNANVIEEIEQRIAEDEQKTVSYVDEFKSDQEKSIARNNIESSSIVGNIFDNNSITYYDYILLSYGVSSNIIVSTSSVSLGCKKVTKGEVFTIHGHSNTGANNGSNIILYYSSERPTPGVEVTYVYSKKIDDGITDAYLEYVAQEDGWLIVRYYTRETNRYVLYQKTNFDRVKELYVPEQVQLPVSLNKFLNADTYSDSFGQVTSVRSSSFGVTDFIDIENVKYINLEIKYNNSPLAKGNTFGSVFYDSDKNPISVAAVINYSNINKTGYRWIEVRSNAKYLRCTTQADRTLYILRNTFEEIEQESNYSKYIPQAKFVSNNPTLQSLGLIHFSDIHGDQTAADEIVKQIIENSSYITDVICSGDSVHYYADSTSTYPNAATWWKETSHLADKSLFVLGNHDSATTASTEYDQKEDSAAWDGKGKDWCFENYFEPFMSSLNYVMPTGYDDSTSPNYHACYWHKDYAAQKIRIIGLDCLHRFDGIVDPATGAITSAGVKWTTNEQELWFIEKLNETLDSTNSVYGYSVIVVCHYPIDDFDGDNEEWNDNTHKFIYNHKATGGRVMSFKTSAPTVFHSETSTAYEASIKFNMNNRIDDGYIDKSKSYPNYKQGTTNNIANIIQYWMNNGGKFVAWLCGHVHSDRMYYSTKYPDILCVAVDQAGCLRGTGSGDRSVGLPSRTCINYYSIDTENGLFKFVRIGYIMNKLMNKHEYLCYDYINKKVLNEG